MKKIKKYLFVLGALLLVVLLACEKEELLIKRTPVVSKQEAQAFLKKYRNDFFTAAISKLRYKMIKLPKHKDSMCFAVLPARVQPKQDAAVLFLAKHAGKVEGHIISAGVAKDPIFDLKKGFSGMLFHWTVDGRLLGKQYFIHHQEVTSEAEVRKFAQYHHELAGSHHKGKDKSSAIGYYYGGGNSGWCYYCNTWSFTNGCTHNTIDEVTVRAVRGVSIPFYLSPAIHILYMGNVTLNFSNFANRMGYGIGGGSPSNRNNRPKVKVDKIKNELKDKAKCVYDALMKSSVGFRGSIQKFIGATPVSHLKFQMADLENTRAKTVAPNSRGKIKSPNYWITILLNSNSSVHGVHYRPRLMTAKTIMHEVLHAEMFRKLLSVYNNGGTVTGMKKQNILDALGRNYPGMYDYYRRYKNWQHQQMAAHYRGAIADVLEDFDNHQHSRQFYMDVAWEGLKKPSIKAWRDLKPSDRNRIKKTIKNYIKANKNQSKKCP